MNNKGWGLQAMLILSSILIIALFIVVIIVNTNLRFLRSNKSEEFMQQYKMYENRLTENAKKYIADNSVDTTREKFVSYKTLLNEKYIEKFIDPNTNLECNGYVSVKDNNYRPYLKCSLSYKTSGYNFQNE